MDRSPFRIEALQRAVCLLPLLALLAGVALMPTACSSSTPNPNPDGGAPDSGIADGGDAGSVSACGQPGDQAVNDAGIGEYCESTATCPGSTICSNLGNGGATPNTFFCVLVCNQCSAPDFCGPGASCVCYSDTECGCTPNSCSALFPDAGNPPCDAG